MEENNRKAEENLQADGRLSPEEENRIDLRIRIGVIIGAVAILAYLIWCGVYKKGVGVAYYVIISVFISLYWLFTDVISMKLKHGFAGRTKAQKSAYFKMAAIDIVGCVGLALFLMGGIGEGSSGSGSSGGNTSLIGAVVYMFSMIYGKRLRAGYLKDPSEAEKEAQEKGEAEKREADVKNLPTAADRNKRKTTAAERLAILNRKAQEAGESDEHDADAGSLDTSASKDGE